MHRLIRAGQIQPGPTGTVAFEGERYGSGVSIYLLHTEPGGGPPLHRHPYSETWVVRRGQAGFTADGEYVEAGPGDMLVVGAETPHKFENIGAERLDMTCIHSSPRFIQENLE